MHELDGEYNVKTTTNYDGPLQKKSDGTTYIENGQTHRVDDAGCEWRSTFDIISETEVKMTSVADPKNASIDFLLTKPNGDPTSEAVTYETTLKLQRKGDRIQMSGQINYGREIILITMRKIG
jgi:hypothetical protein